MWWNYVYSRLLFALSDALSYITNVNSNRGIIKLNYFIFYILQVRMNILIISNNFLLNDRLFLDAISESSPRVVDDNRARKLSNELRRCSYYETCATYGLNVERVFQDGKNKFNLFLLMIKSLNEQAAHLMLVSVHRQLPTYLREQRSR